MPYDPALAERLREAVAPVSGIIEKPMFGGICWMLNGNMLCGVEVGRYMFRVGKEQERGALQRPGSQPVAFNGRKMGGIVWVDSSACEEAELGSWLALARNFVETLPPK